MRHSTYQSIKGVMTMAETKEKNQNGASASATTPVTDTPIMINESTAQILGQVFVLQQDTGYENESKFNRAFVFDAVNAQAKAFCSRIVGQYDSAINKLSL